MSSRRRDLLTTVFFATVTLLLVKCEAQYQTYYLENPKVCPPFGGKNKLKILPKSSSAFLIKLTKYPTVADSLTGCHLEIDAPKGYGLQAVIEEINLRTHSVFNETCMDYVRFGRDGDGMVSPEICGRRYLFPQQRDGAIGVLSTDRHQATTFYDPGGELHLWFSRSPEKTPEASPLELKIVITAYRHTCKVNDTDLWSCPINPSMSPKFRENCIPSNLVCDGHINCGAAFYNDEVNCRRSFLDRHSNSTVTVAIFVVVSILLLSLISTVYCFWRRRRARFRRSQEPTTCEQHACSSGDIHHTDRLTVTIPLQEWQEPPSDPEPRGKPDLPPSYDELFPEATSGPGHSIKSN